MAISIEIAGGTAWLTAPPHFLIASRRQVACAPLFSCCTASLLPCMSATPATERRVTRAQSRALGLTPGGVVADARPARGAATEPRPGARGVCLADAPAATAKQLFEAVPVERRAPLSDATNIQARGSCAGVLGRVSGPAGCAQRW